MSSSVQVTSTNSCFYNSFVPSSKARSPVRSVVVPSLRDALGSLPSRHIARFAPVPSVPCFVSSQAEFMGFWSQATRWTGPESVRSCQTTF